jgi:hypothetical protein
MLVTNSVISGVKDQIADPLPHLVSNFSYAKDRLASRVIERPFVSHCTAKARTFVAAAHAMNTWAIRKRSLNSLIDRAEMRCYSPQTNS